MTAKSRLRNLFVHLLTRNPMLNLTIQNKLDVLVLNSQVQHWISPHQVCSVSNWIPTRRAIPELEC